MYDDYVVEWDLAFAEYLKKLASIFLKETPDYGPISSPASPAILPVLKTTRTMTTGWWKCLIAVAVI